MDIRFLGKNLSVTQGIKDHLEERLSRLEKYAPRLVESHVVLKKEKYLYKAEITLLAKDLRVYGEAQSKENIFAAIDLAYERIEKQLKKFREKVKRHHGKSGKKVFAVLNEGPDRGESRAEEAGTRPVEIIKTDAFVAKPMSPEEASQQLEISRERFLVFINSTNQRVSVIYRREDEKHGLVEPEY